MMVSHEPRMHRPNAREGRDLERPPPARDLVVDRTVHKTPNIFPVAYSHPTPSGVREAFMPACDREVEESHAQSASRSTRGRSAKIRASVVTTLFFLCVFFLRVSWSFPRERRLVVVPDRARLRVRARSANGSATRRS